MFKLNLHFVKSYSVSYFFFCYITGYGLGFYYFTGSGYLAPFLASFFGSFFSYFTYYFTSNFGCSTGLGIYGLTYFSPSNTRN